MPLLDPLSLETLNIKYCPWYLTTPIITDHVYEQSMYINYKRNAMQWYKNDLNIQM